jgi:hypothetical protein
LVADVVDFFGKKQGPADARLGDHLVHNRI